MRRKRRKSRRSRHLLFDNACPWGRASPRRFAAPLRGRLRPPPRAVPPTGVPKAESPAEARFTSPIQNCYNTTSKQESIVSTRLRNRCCTGYWLAGGIYDVRTDGIVALFDTSDPSWPQDDGRFRLAGIENGVGIMFAGLRTWMLVDWDGKLVRSGPLRRKGIGSTGWTIGHRRLVVHLFGSDDWAVLSLDNKLLYRGCSPLPSPDGYLLICGQDWW